MLGLEIRAPIIDRANLWAASLELNRAVLFLRCALCFAETSFVSVGVCGPRSLLAAPGRLAHQQCVGSCWQQCTDSGSVNAAQWQHHTGRAVFTTYRGTGGQLRTTPSPCVSQRCCVCVRVGVCVCRGNATITLDHTLSSYPGSLDLACVQFPDPHFKTRHKCAAPCPLPPLPSLSSCLMPLLLHMLACVCPCCPCCCLRICLFAWIVAATSELA
jgi:hypothetical protein